MLVKIENLFERIAKRLRSLFHVGSVSIDNIGNEFDSTRVDVEGEIEFLEIFDFIRTEKGFVDIVEKVLLWHSAEVEPEVVLVCVEDVKESPDFLEEVSVREVSELPRAFLDQSIIVYPLCVCVVFWCCTEILLVSNEGVPRHCEMVLKWSLD